MKKIRIGEIPGIFLNYLIPREATVREAINAAFGNFSSENQYIKRDKLDSGYDCEVRINAESCDDFDSVPKDGDKIIITHRVRGDGPRGPRRGITITIDGHYKEEDLLEMQAKFNDVLGQFCCSMANVNFTVKDLK